MITGTVTPIPNEMMIMLLLPLALIIIGIILLTAKAKKEQVTQTSTQNATKKVVYWIIGLLLALFIFMAGFSFWNGGQPATTDSVNNTNSTSSSGSGNNNHNPAQEIQKHLKQMGF